MNKQNQTDKPEKTTQDQPPLKDLDFETAVRELSSIVKKLESGEASLEDSITLYERGVTLQKHCEKKLSDARSKIEKITQTDSGEITTEPLDQ